MIEIIEEIKLFCCFQVKHARTGTNRKRKRKVDYEEESDEEDAEPFACKKCGKYICKKIHLGIWLSSVM